MSVRYTEDQILLFNKIYIEKTKEKFNYTAKNSFDPDLVWYDMRTDEDDFLKQELIKLPNRELFNKYFVHFDFIVACKKQEGIPFKPFTIRTIISHLEGYPKDKPKEEPNINHLLKKRQFVKPVPLVFED